MNKKPNSKYKYLYIGMIFYVLIFFSAVGFIGHVMNAKAAPSSQLIPADIGTPDTTTPVPTTPVDTTTPAPTTPAVTVTAAPTTPATQPTTPATQPTTPATQPTTPPVMLPPGAGPTNNTGVTATPSATATGTATTTPTAVTKPSGTTPTSLTQNTTNTPPSKPDTGSDAGGPSMLGLSLGIGTPVLLLFGGGLFWLYLRRRQQGVTGLQFGSPTNSSWISSNDMATNNNFSPVLGSFAANSSTLPAPYTTNPLLSSNAGMTSIAANTLQQATLPPFAELAGPLYTPSDLRPITMALPQPFPNQTAPDATPYPPTSDMNPLSFEALNLPQNIAEMMAPQQRPNIADMLAPQQTPDIPISTTATHDHLPNPIQNSPTPAVAIQPPDPANNAVLENVMRQAQLGLFVIPNR
jgi:hypothetical protein